MVFQLHKFGCQLLIKERRELFSRIGKNIPNHPFQQKTKPTLSVVEKSPVTHAELDEKKEFSQPSEASTSYAFSHKNVKDLEIENEFDSKSLKNGFLQNVNQTSASLLINDPFIVQTLLENAEQIFPSDYPHNYPYPFDKSVDMPSSVDQVLTGCPVKDNIEGTAKKIEDEQQTFLNHTATLLDSYKEIIYNIFEKLPEKSNENLCFKNIENYCSMLKGPTILNEERGNISPSCVLDKLRTLGKSRLEDVEKTKDRFNALELNDDDNISFGDLDLTTNSKVQCKKTRKHDDSKNIGLQLVSEQNKCVSSNHLKFLRNRIKLLKSILIEENMDLQELWNRASDQSGKMLVKDKILQHYLKNYQTQASVEMLFFDCMSILNSKEMHDLWKKANNLVGGFNLRNFLADGQSQLESLDNFFAPYDMPFEFVGKILQLISDENAIDSMLQILEQSGSDFSGFVKIMNDEKNNRFINLREQIMKCDHWKEYALLIPFSKR